MSDEHTSTLERSPSSLYIHISGSLSTHEPNMNNGIAYGMQTMSCATKRTALTTAVHILCHLKAAKRGLVDALMVVAIRVAVGMTIGMTVGDAICSLGCGRCCAGLQRLALERGRRHGHHLRTFMPEHQFSFMCRHLTGTTAQLCKCNMCLAHEPSRL